MADNSNYFVSDILVHNSPEVVPGGNALKFYASLRIEVRRSAQIKDKKGAVVGNQIKAKVVKNKLAAPYRSCIYDILYGEGVSLEGEIIDVGSELGVVDKSGSWYSYEGTKIGQGKDSVREFLKDNPELAESIAARIREAIA